jgi:hypothetical protein
MQIEATFRAKCRRCGARFRWRGTMADMPPCPGCGQALPPLEKERAQRQLELAAQQDALSRLTRGIAGGGRRHRP